MTHLGVRALPVVRPRANPRKSNTVAVIQRGVQQRHSPAAVEQDEDEKERLEPERPGPEHGGI
jgi:hypothetical protein